MLASSGRHTTGCEFNRSKRTHSGEDICAPIWTTRWMAPTISHPTSQSKYPDELPKETRSMVCLGGSRVGRCKDRGKRRDARDELGGDRTCRSSPIGGGNGHLHSLSQSYASELCLHDADASGVPVIRRPGNERVRLDPPRTMSQREQERSVLPPPTRLERSQMVRMSFGV